MTQQWSAGSVGALGTSLHRPLGLLLLLGCCEVGGSCDCFFLVLSQPGFFSRPGFFSFGLSSCITHNFHSSESRLGNLFEFNRALLTLKLASLPIKFANKPKKFAYPVFCCFRH